MALADTLLSYVESVEDSRTPYWIEHRLLNTIALTIYAVVCGAEIWVEVEAYRHSKVAWLSRFSALLNSIPFHDAVSRLFPNSPQRHCSGVS